MLYSSDRLAYLIPSRRLSRPTLCIILDSPQSTHPAMSSSQQPITRDFWRGPLPPDSNKIIYKRLFDYGNSAVAKSKEMETALNTIEGLPSEVDLDTEASKLMHLAAELISIHIAMHVTSRGYLNHSHEDLLTKVRLNLPTSFAQSKDLITLHRSADSVGALVAPATWGSLHLAASGEPTGKADSGIALKSGSTAVTQKRLCTLLTQPTQSQLPACKALWQNVNPALESTKRFAEVTDDLIIPDKDWFKYPQLVSLIAAGAAKLAGRTPPYEPPTSTPEDAGEASTEADAAGEAGTESSTPPRPGRIAQLIDKFKPDKGRETQGSRAL